MLQLTETEYLPPLAGAYQFRVAPRTDGYSGVEMSVRDLALSHTVYSRNVPIPQEKISDREYLKSAILLAARGIASLPREWNQEFSKNLQEVMAELTPPKDSPGSNSWRFSTGHGD